MGNTRTLTIGLVLASLLGLSDLAVWSFGVGGAGQPPVVAAAVITLLGAVTLAGALFAWRGRRSGVVAVIVTRILSGLAALPAFGDGAISTVNLVGISVGLAATITALALLFPALRRRVVTAP